MLAVTDVQSVDRRVYVIVRVLIVLGRVEFRRPHPDSLRMNQIFDGRILIDLGRVKCRLIKRSLL
jgi:hypothetical protein